MANCSGASYILITIPLVLYNIPPRSYPSSWVDYFFFDWRTKNREDSIDQRETDGILPFLLFLSLSIYESLEQRRRRQTTREVISIGPGNTAAVAMGGRTCVLSP